MRILLDECLPRRLKRHFRSYGLVLTVTDAGLSSYTNGRLLRRISGNFNVFITIDKSMQHQQNLAGRKLAIVIIRARTNRLIDLEPHFPACAEALKVIHPGQIIEVTDK